MRDILESMISEYNLNSKLCAIAISNDDEEGQIYYRSKYLTLEPYINAIRKLIGVKYKVVLADIENVTYPIYQNMEVNK